MARQNEKECLKKLIDAFEGRTRTHIYANCELAKIARFLFSARPNDHTNDFPDFVFNGGGIEHFELTSSKETRKGSAFKIEESASKKAREEHYSKAKEDFLNSEYVPETIYTNNYEEIYEGFSYEDFLRSLERNVVNHVKSLEQINYQEKTVIFLMEQRTARLWIDEGIIPIRFYDLHRDRRALSLIKKHCVHVNYIIYSVGDSIEILDLSLIDQLLAKSVVYKNVQGGRLIQAQINVFINL